MTTYNSKRDAKELARKIKVGDVVWGIDEVDPRNSYEDQCLAHPYTCTKIGLFGPMFDGTIGIERLVLAFGPIHDNKPAGIRSVFDPAPQVGAPKGDGDSNWRRMH